MIGYVCAWQSVTMTSTRDAEYLALWVVTKEVLHFRQLLESLKFSVNSPSYIFEDNNPALSLVHGSDRKAKHIAVAYHAIRDYVDSNDVFPTKIASQDNLADFFTKWLENITSI